MNPSRQVLARFKGTHHTKMCAEITKREFASEAELGEYLETGACDPVINTLVEAARDTRLR